MEPPPGEPAWKVGIRHPLQRDTLLKTVSLRNRALSVSAPHGREFEEGETRFGHVMDPLKGAPSQSTHLAAVKASSAALADAWSTALVAGGAIALKGLNRAGPLAALYCENDKRDLLLKEAGPVSWEE
jgi:thiamine biosynthesis lipoprotein